MYVLHIIEPYIMHYRRVKEKSSQNVTISDLIDWGPTVGVALRP